MVPPSCEAPREPTIYAFRQRDATYIKNKIWIKTMLPLNNFFQNSRNLTWSAFYRRLSLVEGLHWRLRLVPKLVWPSVLLKGSNNTSWMQIMTKRGPDSRFVVEANAEALLSKSKQIWDGLRSKYLTSKRISNSIRAKNQIIFGHLGLNHLFISNY